MCVKLLASEHKTKTITGYGLDFLLDPDCKMLRTGTKHLPHYSNHVNIIENARAKTYFGPV